MVLDIDTHSSDLRICVIHCVNMDASLCDVNLADQKKPTISPTVIINSCYQIYSILCFLKNINETSSVLIYI